MKERKCGCLYFEHGPPVPCEKHQRKLEKKEAREKAKEEKGLRKIVADKALENGHDLTHFKEYGSQPGKWVAHCHSCGGLVIVYENIPERGDQICGQAVFAACRKSDLVGTLGAADRDAFAARFTPKTAEADGENSDEGTSEDAHVVE